MQATPNMSMMSEPSPQVRLSQNRMPIDNRATPSLLLPLPPPPSPSFAARGGVKAVYRVDVPGARISMKWAF